MIPDGTSPDAIILTVVGATFMGFVLMALLFWYRFPDVPRRFMSSIRKVRTTSATSTQAGSTSLPRVETPDTYQAEPSAPPQIELEPNLHNYSRSGLIAILSVQKTETGAYRWTANQIAAFVGGTRSEVLKEIALYRPSPAVPTQVKRPPQGWTA